MMQSNPYFLITFAVTLLAMVVLAFSGQSKAGSRDFSLGGRRSGPWHVSGAITGTLVGGASTIGTAQLAFMYGLSAWWFTLGAGIACLFLGLFLAVPLRHAHIETIPQFISVHHGDRARVVASLFSALGMFIQIVAQLLACGAILAALFNVSLVWSAMLASIMVGIFTFGGMRGAGRLGLVKMCLIYLTMVTAGWLAYSHGGGWQGYRSALTSEPWFNLFGYGVQEGLSDLFSMLVGVISTQTYLQAVFSSRSTSSARGGALLSAVLIPPLGLFGVVVGLYMRRTVPDIQSALALPNFILDQFPPALAGLAFATLLIAAVGTAAGLAMGVATTLRVDVVGTRQITQMSDLTLRRLMTVFIVVGAFMLLLFNLGSAIMEWSFLSMGLRGATLCFPLLFAVLLPKGGLRRAGALSIFIAPVCVVVAGLLKVEIIPPLYLGLGVSLALMSGGLILSLSTTKMKLGKKSDIEQK